MVNYEGYIQSHTQEEVFVPDQTAVDAFLPFQRIAALDINNPQSLNTVTSPEFYMDYKFQQDEATKHSLTVIDSVAADYSERFGSSHNWHGAVETYCADDADHVVITMGSAVSDARIVIDQIRAEGQRIGLIKIRSYRPFPTERLRSLLKSCKLATVIDKSIIFGSGGALGLEVKSSLYGQTGLTVNSFIAGLGGRDFGPQEILQVIRRSEGQPPQTAAYEWFGL
jgi:pyruvate ferredoxin oxidoreductase alpha subunit